MPLFAALVAVAPVIAACQFGADAAFIQGRSLEECVDELPVCNTTAGCRMVEERTYLEGELPGQRSFIVPTDGEAVIRVQLLWTEQLGPGADTEILWFEPACVDEQSFDSEGADVFADSTAAGVFSKERRVFRAGEHLVQIRSDATAKYLLRTEVLTPKEADEEELARGGEIR